MSGLSLSLLGGFTVSLDGKAVDLPTKKSQALLICLAAEPETGHRRETLMDLLWPGMPERSARHNLRQVAYSLRQAIPSLPPAEKNTKSNTVPLLLANRQTIQLHPEADTVVDAVQFDALLEKVQAHDHLDLFHCQICKEDLETAVELYRGDFLADFYLEDSSAFEEWSQVRRERHRRQALDALETLTTIHSRAKAYSEAYALANRQLTIDNLRERAYQQLMEILALSGRREEALAVYENCRNLLGEELGMAPAARTTALYEQILAGDLRFDTPLAQGVRGYELKDQIGEGAYGAIHRAIQPAVGREVAVKVIRRKLANDPEFIRRFEAEAQTVAHLEHPFIVPLYDYWRDTDGAYLVMRYLRGGNLLSALEGGPWEPGQALKMVEQVAGALSAAHRQGVVHRDIKPANILLDEEGNAYLSDFGIAKDLTGEMQLTAEGAIIGTPDYISPEQIKNEPVTPQTDLYSLGAVLYEALTGEKPFLDSSVINLIHLHLNEPVPLVGSSRPDLPAEIDEVIQRATAKRPADRYGDALEMAAAFRAALGTGAPSVVEEIQFTPPAVTELYNPYKGLRAFKEADADDFFGREALTESLIERLSASRFLALVGPSGSGKSSAVKAGLIPALRQGAIPGSEKWFVAEMTPGSHPLEELELALWPVAVDPPPSLVEPMKRDTRGMLRTLRRVIPDEIHRNAGAYGDGAQLLLVIDQFEELFTLVEDPDRRTFFLESLLVALNSPRSPLRVVITLRADFYDRPLQSQVLGALLKENTEIVLPLSPAELTWAVREPARRVGVGLEAGLPEAIVADVSDQPGALPLLQYGLTELFERRSNGQMTRQAYDKIGGVMGALGRRAEEIFADLDKQQQDQTRQLFLRLVTLGEGQEDTRRRVLRSELEAITTADSRRPTAESGSAVSGQSSVVDAFGAARLLTFDHDPVSRGPTAEVAHEALLREWQRLRGWLDESRDDVRMQRMLATAEREWAVSDQDDSYLLRGARLEQFAGWAEGSTVALTGEEAAYLQASLEARETRRAAEEERLARELETAQRLAETERARAEEQTQAAGRLRQRAVLLSGALVIAAVLAVAALFFARQSDENAAEAQDNFALAATRESVALGEAEARATAEANALAALADAGEQREAAQAEAVSRATAEAIAIQEREEAQIQAELATARELAASALVTLEEDPERTILLALRSLRLAYTAEGEEVLRQGMMTSRVRLTIPKSAENVRDVIYNPDSTSIIGLEEDGSNSFVMVWDAVSGELLRSLSCGRLCVGGTISPDGNLIAAADGDFNIVIVDLAASFESGSPQIRYELVGHTRTVIPGEFSADSTRLATTSWDKTLKVWDLEEGRLLYSIEEPALQWLFVPPSFSPDGSLLTTSALVTSVEIGAQIFDAATGELLLALPTDQRWPSFSPDGQRVVTHSYDGSIYLWDVEASLATGIAQELYSFQSRIGGQPAGHAISPDGTYLLEADDKVVLWRLEEDGATEAMLLSGHEPGFGGLSTDFHPDGRHLVTGGSDGIRVWDISSTGEREVLTIDAHGDGNIYLALNRDGTQLATASWDGTARLWDARSGEKLQEFNGHQARVQDVDISPDGNTLVTASDDRTARVWDIVTGEELAVLEASDEGYDVGGVFIGVMSARFSPDGRQIVTGGADGTVRLWDAQTYEPLQRVIINPRGEDEHPRGVTLAIFSPDGSTLAAATDGEDAMFKVWDIETGDVLLEQVEGSRWFGLDFSPDGRRLVVSSCCDGLVQVWDVETGEQLLSLPPQGGTVRRIFFSVDGSQLIFPVNGLTFWDATSGELLQTFSEEGSFVLSPDESRLFVGTSDGLVRAFLMDIDELMALAQSRLTRSLTDDECRQYLHLEACPEE